MSIKSRDESLEKWAYDFLHKPAAFEGRRAQDIIDADFAEAKQIFNKELPKRKANERFKTFMTKDDLELKYWYVSKETNTKLKILVHGSGSNFAKADRAVSLLDHGFNVAMLSYRGHSNNPGQACQKTIIKDVVSGIEALVKEGYGVDQIHLEGSSLGTAVLAHAISRIYQKLGSENQFASLVLKAAPLNIYEGDKDTVESLKTAGLEYEQALPFLRKLWNQEEVYSQVKAKQITIVHGTCDDVVPVEHAHKIKAILDRRNENVILKIIEGEGHRLGLSEYGVF